MTNAEFRRVRDEMALANYRARLPILRAELAQLYAEIAPIWKEMSEPFYRHSSKSHKEKVYARLDGRDWTYQRLSAELAAIERDMWRRWHVPMPERELMTA